MRDLDQQITHLRAQQASAWVSALAKPDGQRQEAFIAWLKESPLNVREFLLSYSIDQSLSQIDPKRRHDIDALLQQINPRVTELSVESLAADSVASVHPQPHRGRAYAIAASIAILGLISWWALVGRQSEWKEFQTGTGEQRALQLEDGSVVHLNALSRIAIKFSATERDIKLMEGEALFEVHHDAQRQFQVFTRDAVIRDIGTRFNVYSRADGMTVAVIEGSVELSAAPATTTSPGLANSSHQAAGKHTLSHTLNANEEAKVDRNGSVQVGKVADISETTAWWQRRLVYRNEPLAHIIEDFNRYNHRRIRLEGEEAMKRSYTGVFDADDPDSLAEVLANDPELVIERLADNTIVIKVR